MEVVVGARILERSESDILPPTLQPWLKLNFGPTGACYQEWSNIAIIGMRRIVAEINPTLATNNIFTTVLVSLLHINYFFLE